MFFEHQSRWNIKPEATLSSTSFCGLRLAFSLTGMTFLLFPTHPSLGQIYTAALYKLLPAFSMTPTIKKTPVFLAISSSFSRVPSPLKSPSLATSKLRSTQSSPAPSKVSPRSIASWKCWRYWSRPSSEREPIDAPKLQVRGYPPRYASGRRRRWAPDRAASWAMRLRSWRVADVVERVWTWATARVRCWSMTKAVDGGLPGGLAGCGGEGELPFASCPYYSNAFALPRSRRVTIR